MIAVSPLTRPVGSLVGRSARRALVLERFGIDYCCHGDRTLAEACREQSVDPEVVLEALLREESRPEEPELTVSGLLGDIVERHHEYLRRALPEVSALLSRIAHVHGERHPETVRLRRWFEPFRLDLIEHMDREEMELFPALRSEVQDPQTLRGLLDTLRRDHLGAGDQLAFMRRLTGGFEVPEDACASYEAAYQALRELEADLHLHVHKENNLLFPLVEKRLAAR